jgi:hypothetical protein
MVTTRRSNPVQNETHEEEQCPNLGRDDVRGEAESAGLEARITQLRQQLVQAQKNVEDLLAQNALLIAAQTPPPLNHDAVEGTNPNGNPEGLGEKAEPRVEDHAEPIKHVPPPTTDVEKWLQQMVLDLSAKYDALSRTVDQKRDGTESLVGNLLKSKDSIFTDEVSNFNLPGRFKVTDISVFQVVKTQPSTWITSKLTCLYTRHPTQWRVELFPLPCQERSETGSRTFSQNRLIISIPLVGRLMWILIVLASARIVCNKRFCKCEVDPTGNCVFEEQFCF